jgi:hypothetical protein
MHVEVDGLAQLVPRPVGDCRCGIQAEGHRL